MNTPKSLDPNSDIPLIRVISPRARRVALRLDSKNRHFKLVIPKGMSEKKAVQFAQKHENWMRQKLSELPPPVQFSPNITLPILGKERVLIIERPPGFKITKIELKENELFVRTNKEAPNARITRFLKTLAREEFSALAQQKAQKISRKIHKISIRDTSSRWGSCSPDGHISFSWRLVFAPWPVIDYITAHEVAHLRHLNHSPDFWALCAELSDEYESGKKWIRQHGQELMRYGA